MVYLFTVVCEGVETGVGGVGTMVGAAIGMPWFVKMAAWLWKGVKRHKVLMVRCVSDLAFVTVVWFMVVGEGWWTTIGWMWEDYRREYQQTATATATVTMPLSRDPQ